MRKPGSRLGLELDLTPMLDVIFIVLMVVMCHQTLDTQTAREELVQLQDTLDQVTAENAVREAQLYAYENEDALVAHVVLYADYETNNPRIRHIRLTRDNESVIEDITIEPGAEDAAYERCREALSAYLTESDALPVMLLLDDTQILYRDQIQLEGMLQELRAEYRNLYQSDVPEEQ
ncbi:MAG: hypothetical protein IJT34_03070 [Butyrivibrio sp.]|nr:hypothetical protein [Butyrivibrio sp.]